MSRPVLEVADIVRQHGVAFLARYGATLSGAQHRALRAIAVCRTAALGGHITQCDHCGHEVQAPKAPREDADGQEEVRPTRHPLGAIEGEAPGGEDTMEMRVMVQLLAPGVEHGEAPNLRAEMRGVPGDVLERLGHRAKE